MTQSPLSDRDLDLLEQTILFTNEDAEALRAAGAVLEPQIDAILDTWYGFVGSHEHLLIHFANTDRAPNASYLAAVRIRFAQWIRDTCAAQYDREWLDRQQEIALRHTRTKKNDTDAVTAATDHIPLRYMIAFIYPITATIRPFLANGGASDAGVERMFQAWFKAVVLHVTLWSLPYAKEGDF